MKQIKMKIELNGETELDVVGVKGRDCKKLTEPIEKALGMVSGVKEKPEIHISANGGNHQHLGHGN